MINNDVKRLNHAIQEHKSNFELCMAEGEDEGRDTHRHIQTKTK